MIKDNSLSTYQQEVLTGLTAPIKYLPSKLFYDTQGLILYNEIMGLPEYYLVNSDIQILKSYGKKIIQAIAMSGKELFNIVDLGAGNALKTQILLEESIKQNLKFHYMPIDIDAASLASLHHVLVQRFPKLSIETRHGDYFEILQNLKDLAHPKLILFLGSSIGNYTTEDATQFLNKLNASLNPGDKLLIGFDLVKDPAMTLAAYNDQMGITKKFNLNLLTRLNNEFGADFDLQNFIHYPSYDPLNHAAQSYLISTKQQTVNLRKLHTKIEFYPWEPIHTETSYKYQIEQINQFAVASHFNIRENFYDDKKYFVNSLWEPK